MKQPSIESTWNDEDRKHGALILGTQGDEVEPNQGNDPNNEHQRLCNDDNVRGANEELNGEKSKRPSQATSHVPTLHGAQTRVLRVRLSDGFAGMVSGSRARLDAATGLQTEQSAPCAITVPICRSATHAHTWQPWSASVRAWTSVSRPPRRPSLLTQVGVTFAPDILESLGKTP